jgi:colicin import membrane protein
LAALQRGQELNAAALAAHALRREEAARHAAPRTTAEARITAPAEIGTAGGLQASALSERGDGDPGYVAQLIGLIRPRILFAVPDGTSPDVFAEFEVDLLPTGGVLDVRRLKASGLPGYDEAVERAIRRISPFPVKRDGTVDRTVLLRFRPVE